MSNNISCHRTDLRRESLSHIHFVWSFGFYRIRFGIFIGFPKENESEWKLSYWNQHRDIITYKMLHSRWKLLFLKVLPVKKWIPQRCQAIAQARLDPIILSNQILKTPLRRPHFLCLNEPWSQSSSKRNMHFSGHNTGAHTLAWAYNNSIKQCFHMSRPCLFSFGSMA